MRRYITTTRALDFYAQLSNRSMVDPNAMEHSNTLYTVVAQFEDWKNVFDKSGHEKINGCSFSLLDSQEGVQWAVDSHGVHGVQKQLIPLI